MSEELKGVFVSHVVDQNYQRLQIENKLMREALEKIAIGDGELEHGGNNCECYECIAEQTLEKLK